MNYRGIKPAEIVTVLEGNGTEENPYQNVMYVICHQTVAGLHRMYTVGKIVELTEEERGSFNPLTN